MKDLTKEQQFEFYREIVQHLATSESPAQFPNSSAKHAAVVLANMLRTCNDVVIYDTHLKGDIAYQHEDFLNELFSFIGNPRKSLKMIIKGKENIKENKLYKYIVSHHQHSKKRADIGIYLVQDKRYVDSIKELAKEFSPENNDINFAVGDSRAYRLEEFSEEVVYKAKCSFNAKEKVQKLEDVVNKDFNIYTIPVYHNTSKS